MKRMFASATLKLTAWYMLILVSISIVFSVIIFEISTAEISRRLERLQVRIEGTDRTVTLPGPLTLSEVRMNQTNEARASIFVGLFYTNLAVIVFGGVGAFLLARRTLRPIQSAQEKQARFVSDASHELRTPLAIIKSEIQVLLRDPSVSKKELIETLESNLEEVDKLTELSSSLLQLSRLEEGHIEREEKILITKTLQSVKHRFTSTSQEIVIDSPKDKTVMIEGNITLISDMLSIVLDNAVKHGKKGTPITIKLTSNGRMCHIDITNSGSGIPEHELERVFDRFYQVDNSRSYPRYGYGLGLALAKQIVTLHEGKILMHSELGKSTTCSIILPTLRKNR